MSMEKRNPEHDPLTFKFGDYDIRVIKDEGHEPLFVAADLCNALGLGNISKALAGLPDDEKAITNGYTLGGMQKQLMVTESGMYRLVFRSNKDEAEKFRRWVFHEVLPALRETGSYAVQPTNLTPFQIMRQMIDTLESMQGQITEVKHDLAEVKALVQPEDDYFTVASYFSYFKLGRLSNEEAQAIGKRAAALSRQKGVEMIDVPHVGAYWKTVHSYHISILNEVVNRPLLP
jgi:prophage antirepressor-like protein